MPSIPSDAKLEEALRDAVNGFYQADDFDSLTLRRVRVVAARKLDLLEDFFKSDATWKDRSKVVVNAEVVSECVHLKPYYQIHLREGTTRRQGWQPRIKPCDEDACCSSQRRATAIERCHCRCVAQKREAKIRRAKA